MTHDEMRFLRRELINYHLQNTVPYMRTTVFLLRDIKFLVRNGEIYRYKMELQAYKDFPS